MEGQLNLLFDQDKLLKHVVGSMVPVVRKRVHEDGLDADGNLIGTYSAAYMKQRQKAPTPRTSDTKVILSRHRQMENDIGALPIEGGWAIAFLVNNQDRFSKAKVPPTNYEKLIFNETRYNKRILTALTPDEDKLTQQIAEDYITDILNAIP